MNLSRVIEQMKSYKCFGIGLNKTGTQTLRAALQKLGYSTLGFVPDLLEKYQEGDIQSAVMAAGSYDAFTNWPWPLIYPMLDDAYPGSKFILTLRKDPVTWYRSLCRHAEKTGPTQYRKIVYGHYQPWESEQNHLSFYDMHIKSVREYFDNRPDQLLIVCWESGDDWQQVCNFLGHEVPDGPFPHENRGTISVSS